MYCRACGEKVNDNQAICLKCGVEVGKGSAYCSNCGKHVSPEAAVCLSCGVAIEKKKNGKYLNGKDKLTIALICFFFGGIGIHNFMMGENKKGIMKIVFMFLCGISSILALIDFIKILAGSYKYDPEASF